MNHLNMDGDTRGCLSINIASLARTSRVGDATEDVRGITVRGVRRAGDPCHDVCTLVFIYVNAQCWFRYLTYYINVLATFTPRISP